jgi:hypothetical protein
MLIEIIRTKDCWIARFPKNSEEAQIMKTRDIPTAFTASAPFLTVLETLQKNYPNDIICGGTL